MQPHTCPESLLSRSQRAPAPAAISPLYARVIAALTQITFPSFEAPCVSLRRRQTLMGSCEHILRSGAPRRDLPPNFGPYTLPVTIASFADSPAGAPRGTAASKRQQGQSGFCKGCIEP